MSEYKSLDGIKESIKNVYGWQVENNVANLKMDLPHFVKERVEYFREETEDGLTFMGYMTAVLGHEEDEKENREIFDMFASIEWLPVSEEFKKWRDEYFAMRQLEVAIAIIYGAYEWEREAE